MDLFDRFRLVDSADGGKSSGSGYDSGSALDRITDLLRKNISLELPTVPFSGESRYLTPLWVFGNGEPREELRRSDSSLRRTTSFKLRAEKIVPHHLEIKDKIRAALKLLTFREQRVLIQFWSTHVVGKHRLLTTVDQPFGLGVADEGLCLYRKDSERNLFVVDEDHEEDDLSPPARVFRRGLPEWTSDVTNYLPKDFPQQDRAICCNLHGYLALPVFDLTTWLCVGVLELLTSSKYMGYAYEVQQVHSVLKTANLTSPQVFDCPISNVPNEHRQHQLDKIFSILKIVCESHSLPLAQTWAVSPFSSFVSHEKFLKKSCSSFNTRCIGKMCMSTAALPFYIRDLDMWHFREACREQHLEKSLGFVGRALSSHGSCFCGDVTKLSEEEYPLVHNARMSGLTGCLAIFLHSVEGGDDYVLEFFLPSDNKDDRCVLNLVQTLKQNIEVASGFELGDISSTEVVGPPREVSNLSLSIEPDTIQSSSTTMANTLTFRMDSLDSQSVVANIAKSDTANVQNQWPSNKNDPNHCGGVVTNTEKLVGNDVISDSSNVVSARQNHSVTSHPNASMQRTSDTFTCAGEKRKSLKQSRKRKIDSLTLEAVEQHIGTPIGEAARNLGVSRSTLKRFCREHDIPSWPVPPHIKRTAYVPDSKLSQRSWSEQELERSSIVRFGIVSAVSVLVRVKRWSCSSNRHGFSSRWWICGKHSGFLSESKLSREAYSSLKIANPSSIPPEDEPNCQPSFYFSQLLNESEGFTVTATQFSKSWKKRFGIYEAACLLLRLKRWRKRSSRLRREYLAVCENTGKPAYTTSIVGPYLHPYVVDWQLSDASETLHASLKRSVTNVLDIAPSVTGMVTVKANFRDDMIKFRLPLSSGLLELENEVAQRFKLKSRSLLLKYKDEDDDLILIACDADLHNLLGSSLATSGGNSTIKLIVQVSDN